MDKSTIRDVMSAMGRKGGKASGPARMEKMTPEERSEVARTAAKKSAEVRTKKAAAKKRAAEKLPAKAKKPRSRN